MRVSLLHNGRSGSKDHTADELVDTVHRFGHEVVSVSHSLEELTATLRRDATELIAIAGGDGTVSRAACALAGSRTPMTIFPLGTANDTARALGIQGDAAQIVQSWSRAQLVPFDLIDAQREGHSSPFAESMGWGVFPSVIAESKQQQAASAERSLSGERELFRRALASATPRHYQVSVDDRDCSGDYLMVEVMNVRFLGPQLELSPISTPDDGLLEVTLWGEGERETLAALFGTGRLPGGAPHARRGQRARVLATDALLHIDGHLVDQGHDHARETQLRVRPAAVHYLVGRA